MAHAKILVVEDESVVALDIKLLLIELGYTVPAIARSGPEAIRLATEIQPDLVLMDIRLQGDMDGIDAVAQIRERCHAAVVFLTAHADIATLERAKQTRPYGYLIKPFEKNQLKPTIEIALYKHEMEEQERRVTQQLQHEIAERKRAEATLRESEQKLRNIIDHSTDGIALVNEVGLIIEWNPAYEEITGLQRADVLGQSLWDVQRKLSSQPGQPVSHEQAKQMILDVLQTGQAPWLNHLLEDEIERLDGTRKIIQTTVFSIRTERGFMLSTMARDVTEHKQVEMALRESEEKIRALLNAPTDAVFMADVNGIILALNETAAQRFGRDVDELVGVCAYDLMPPDVAETRKAQGNTVIHSGQPAIFEDQRAGMWFENRIYPVFGDRGIVTGVAVVARDITESKQMELALQESEERLRSLIQNMQIAVVVHAADTSIVQSNPKAQEFLGLTEAQMLGKSSIDPYWRFLEKDGRDMPLERYPANLVLATREILEGHELGVYHPDTGIVTWVLVNAIPEMDLQGEVTQIIVTFVDITERRRTQEAYRNLVDYSLQGLAIFQDDQLVFCNAQYATTRGYTVDELLSQPPDQLFDNVHPDDSERVQAYAHARLSGDPVPEYYELRIIRKDGQVRWLESYHASIHYDGKPAIQSMFIDITERKQAEQALRESEEQYRDLVENMNDVIFTIDEKGIMTFVSSAVEALLERIPSEVIGQPFAKFIYHEDLPRIQETFLYLAVGGPYSGPNEYRVVTKSGAVRWTRISSRPILLDDHIIGVQGILADITERRQAEQALREQNWVLQKAQEIGNMGTWEWDLETDKIRLSALAISMLGLDPENESHNSTLGGFLDLVHPDDRETYYRNIEQARHFPDPHPQEVRIIRPDGAVRVVHLEGEVIDDANGIILKRIGVIHDITVRKQTEQQRIELAKERERANVLQAFISNASHDLRTPLTTIKTRHYLLRHSAEPEKQHAHMKVLETQTTHLERLLEDMLQMSRLDMAAEFQYAPVDLNALIQRLLVAQRLSAESKHLNIHFAGNPTVPLILADTAQLSRAITNIVVNAISYTPDGENISIQTFLQNDQVVIEVRDTGIGIDQNDLPRIFERFYRADAARSTGKGMAGLGLAMAKKIIEGHQGSIEVESSLGKGSTFRILLPIYE